MADLNENLVFKFCHKFINCCFLIILFPVLLRHFTPYRCNYYKSVKILFPIFKVFCSYFELWIALCFVLGLKEMQT